MTFLRVTRPRAGPRVYVLGARVHHGPPMAAAALVLALRGHPALAVLALAAAAHDARDFPWRDCDNHYKGRPCA